MRNHLAERRKQVNRVIKAQACDEMVAGIAAECEETSQALHKIDRFRASHKKKALLNQHKLDWIEEWEHMGGFNRKLTSELEDVMKRISSHSDSGIEVSISRALQEHTAYERERQELLAVMQQRLASLRAMIQSSDSSRARLVAQEILSAREENEAQLLGLREKESELDDGLHEVRKLICSYLEDEQTSLSRHDELRAVLGLLGELQLPEDVARSDMDHQPEKYEDQHYQIVLVKSEITEKLLSLIEQRDSAQAIAEDEWLRRSILAKGCEEQARDETGGWDPKDHAMVQSIWKQNSLHGRQRGRLLERLRLQLPHLSADQVSHHVDWIEARHALNTRKTEIQRAWQRERASLLSWAAKALSDTRQEIARSEEIQRALGEDKARREALHQRLEELRVARTAEEKIRSARLAEEEAQNRQLVEQKERSDQIAQKKRRAAVQRFQLQKREAAQKRAEEAAVSLALAEEEKRRRRADLLQRVNYRDNKRQEKLESLREMKWRADQREKARRNAIAKIAASVPYAQAIAQAKADLTKSTASIENAVFNPESFRQNPHSITQGFSDQKLFSDKRFKLGFALHNAGINTSAAAAAVVRAACPVEKRPYI